MNAQFSEREGILTVGGVAINRLADRAGRTPFFVYDRATLDARVCMLRETLPTGIDLHYSVKAAYSGERDHAFRRIVIMDSE
ncbi:hypothetical protein [Burkholderia vietnamiensis]|uniref:hypothetical protein n=1 Tax=Burkholderia vietnamiensis TaxID=60552 RepID=UPI001FC86191|nr:hypothetical protein [Burkholderia vietnamiensis]